MKSKESSTSNRDQQSALFTNAAKIAYSRCFKSLLYIGIVVAAFGGCLKKSAAELPILGNVPDFTLTERSGKPFTRAELDGKIWIADFIFTNCGGTCPIMTTAMAELQKTIIENEMPGVRLVSISVDPERDTPEALTQFARGYGAEPSRWHFLTGDGKAIQELANQGFHLAAATGIAEEEQIIHSNRFVLVDAQARIRGYYDGTDEQAVQKLQQDLKKLYKTRQPS